MRLSCSTVDREFNASWCVNSIYFWNRRLHTKSLTLKFAEKSKDVVYRNLDKALNICPISRFLLISYDKATRSKNKKNKKLLSKIVENLRESFARAQQYRYSNKCYLISHVNCTVDLKRNFTKTLSFSIFNLNYVA